MEQTSHEKQNEKLMIGGSFAVDWQLRFGCCENVQF